MTKKDFELIADAIAMARNANSNDNDNWQDALNVAVTCLCNRLENDNPRFDREKFRAACSNQ